MGNFARGVQSGFDKAFPTAVQGGIESATKNMESRRKLAKQFEQNTKLGKLISELDLPEADKIGQALGDNIIDIGQAISLSNALQKGTQDPLELALLGKLGVDVSGYDKKQTSGIDAAIQQPSGDIAQQPKSTTTQPNMELKSYKAGGATFEKVERDTQAEKLDLEKQEQEKIEKKKTEMIMSSAEDTIETIGNIKAQINQFGLFGQLPSVPGNKRMVWEANFEKLKSKLVLDLMTQLKEASKTGSTGFGQLSEKELKVLEDGATALRRTLPKEEAMKILNKMEKVAQKVLIKAEPKQQEDFSSMSDEELMAIVGGK